MTETEKELRDRMARLTKMLELLDSETKRLQQMRRRVRRENRLRRRGRIH